MADRKKNEVRDYNFVAIQGWMRNKLELSGNELIVYTIIYGFSQAKNQWCSASIEYFAEWTGASEKTINRIINRLEENGHIKKRHSTNEIGWYCEYKAIIPESISEGNGQNDQMGFGQSVRGNGQNDQKGLDNLSADTIKENIYNNINNNIGDKSPASAPKKKFVKPTVEEVAAYIRENYYSVDAQRFCDYYESNGWKVGKSQMKNWKAAVRTWQHNGYSNNSSTRNSTGCGNNNPEGFDEIFG